MTNSKKADRCYSELLNKMIFIHRSYFCMQDDFYIRRLGQDVVERPFSELENDERAQSVAN